MDISVCIANWNCRELLRECLRSLLRQPQGVRLEVIVVDNASVDGASEMVACEFPEVILIRNARNEGFARASNQAARAAMGRYLFFLNNDTCVPPNSLRRLMDYAEAHPGVGMFGPRLKGGDGRFQISYRSSPTTGALLHRTLLLRWTGLFARSYREYRRNRYNPDYCGPVDLLMGAAVLMPRWVFENGGHWDEDFVFGGEDLELSARIRRRWPIHFVNQVDIIHHGRVSSRLNIGFSTESVAVGFVKYLRKTGTPTVGLWLYKLVVILDAPLQVLAAVIQGAVRWLRGRPVQARGSFLAARGAWHFMRHSLLRFWQA
ncbi:MAG: glycosyltransferase family 2 protein [Gemmataceae bacterium]|nr:glycosyltransferase family 2 protein [Gemmataceae bacterium]